jgi:hypothetical protein
VADDQPEIAALNKCPSHLVLLSRAPQRDGGALDVPATLKVRQKIVGHLVGGKLVEEVRHAGHARLAP